jgi:photosystem II stability/assembly factor-like uncharacterized protein
VHRGVSALLLVIWTAAAWAQAPAGAEQGIAIESSVFGALRARGIGPAVMSGRITALDAVCADPRIVYVGAAAGGVWKSKDGGITHDPVFDDHCQSIGAICIDQDRPDTVWVGTGEPWVRNSVSVGDGVYRTVDGGENWQRLGLEATERIGRIAIDPVDPAVVYVAALGGLWSAGPERGLFRTRDGGATWEKVLYVDENTGCSDVSLVPGTPNVVFAAMWDYRRSPDFFRSGGPGSGLYRSIDGGETWERLTRGLPEGELGRIAVAVSPSRPSRIYACVESDDTGFYRSDDMGTTWIRLSDQRGIKGRPFYFNLVVPDPVDPDRVYKPGYVIWSSTDAGERFDALGGWVHVDYHALWVDPADPSHMYCGNDGGVYVTYNRGSTWRHCGDLPVSQFYRVSVDQAEPYNVYGGLQDNGSWRGPSRSPGGIENADWENLGAGDGFCVVPDPRDPDIVYWESQGGNVRRLHLSTGDNKDIQPKAQPGEPEYRWNWNTPIATSPADPARLYVGCQFLMRSTDRGDSWERLSGDLTTNDPALQRQLESGGLTVDNTSAENHCTIYTIAESPRDGAVIWIGTDDGNLQVTADDGATWTNVAGKVKGVPRGTWVSCVEPGRHDRATAFATFDGHRRGDLRPYVFRTDDLGATWRPLATDAIRGYCHVIRQDPVNPDLLFLGTESGLYITLDGGLNWARYEEDFPPAPVMDLVIHERENDLVIATHGRGIWILDDFQPLRQITREGLAQPVYLLESPPAFQTGGRYKQHSPGNSYFVAGNPSQTAKIIYFLQKRHMFGDMKIEIFSPEGELLKTLPGGKRKGINVVSWQMRLKPPRVTSAGTLDPAIAYAGSYGPQATEGTYTYRLTKGEEVHEGRIEVIADPNSPHSVEDRLLQQRTVMRLYRLLEEASYVAQAMAEARDAARERAGTLGEKDGLARKLNRFADDLTELKNTITASEEEVQGISGERQLRENLIRLYAAVGMYSGRPGESQIGAIPVYEEGIAKARADFQSYLDESLEGLNRDLAKKELEPITILTEEEYREREEG